MYIQKGLTLGYTAQSLNLFYSQSFFNAVNEHLNSYNAISKHSSTLSFLISFFCSFFKGLAIGLNLVFLYTISKLSFFINPKHPILL